MSTTRPDEAGSPSAASIVTVRSGKRSGSSPDQSVISWSLELKVPTATRSPASFFSQRLVVLAGLQRVEPVGVEGDAEAAVVPRDVDRRPGGRRDVRRRQLALEVRVSRSL